MARTKTLITGSTEDHREVLQGEQLLPHGSTSQRTARGGAVKFSRDTTSHASGARLGDQQ
jgi:hypothetical protein